MYHYTSGEISTFYCIVTKVLERYPRLLQNYGFTKQGGNANEIQGIAIDKKKRTKDPKSKTAISKEIQQL